MQTGHSFDRQFYQPISSCKRDTPSTASFISQSARANETLLRPPVLSANQLVQTRHAFDLQFYQPISSCKRDTPSTASFISQSARANETLLRPPVLSANQLVQTRHSFDLQFSPASSAAQNHFHSSVNSRGNEVSGGEGAEGLSCGTCNKECRNVTKNVGTPIVLLPPGNSNTWVSPLLRRALRQRRN